MAGVEIIDTLDQKNNGLFPIVDANDVIGGLYTVYNTQGMYDIPTQRRREGMLCYVIDVSGESKMYQLKGGTSNLNWVIFNSGESTSADDIYEILMDYSLTTHEHNNVYYTKNQVYNKDEVYSIYQVYRREEVYNKDETYSKEQAYSKAEVNTLLSVIESTGTNFILGSAFLDSNAIYKTDGVALKQQGKIIIVEGTYIDLPLGSIFGVLKPLENIIFNANILINNVEPEDMAVRMSIIDSNTNETYFQKDLIASDIKDEVYYATGPISKSSTSCFVRLYFPAYDTITISRTVLSLGSSIITWSPSTQDAEVYVDKKIKELLNSNEFNEQVKLTINDALKDKADKDHTHTEFYTRAETYSKKQVDTLLANYTPSGDGGGTGTGESIGSVSNYFLLKEINRLISYI